MLFKSIRFGLIISILLSILPRPGLSFSSPSSLHHNQQRMSTVLESAFIPRMTLFFRSVLNRSSTLKVLRSTHITTNRPLRIRKWSFQKLIGRIGYKWAVGGGLILLGVGGILVSHLSWMQLSYLLSGIAGAFSFVPLQDDPHDWVSEFEIEATKIGLTRNTALQLMQTITSMSSAQLEALVGWGVITENERSEIEAKAFASIDPRPLAARLGNVFQAYQQQGYSKSFIRALLETHLLPVSEIQRLQRTYRLHQDTSVIEDALYDWDVEKKISLVMTHRVEAEIKKLVYGRSHKMLPLLSQSERVELLGDLKERHRILKKLYDNPPDPVELYFNVISDSPDKKDRSSAWVILRIDGKDPIPMRPFGKVYLPNLNKPYTVHDLDHETREVLLRIPKNAIKSLKRSDEPLRVSQPMDGLEIQLEALEFVIENLELSNYQTTGLPMMDRFVGLRPLTPSDPTQTGVTEEMLFNKKILDDVSEANLVEMGLNPTELLLVNGMAGAGKSTALVEIILQQTIKRGTTVLVLAPTNHAVDELMLALHKKDSRVPMLRLGRNVERIAHDLHGYWAGREDGGPLRRFFAIKKTREIDGVPIGGVIGATPISLVTQKDINLFDWTLGLRTIILDEMGQTSWADLAVIFGHLGADGKFIGLGDTVQLGPNGADQEQASSADLNSYEQAVLQASALEFALDQEIGDVADLVRNWRSIPLLAMLFSRLFYRGRLIPRGFEDFKADTLRIEEVGIPGKFELEEAMGKGFRNKRSAARVLSLIAQHAESGTPFNKITILTPYTVQKLYLEQLLFQEYGLRSHEIVVSTIDGYQGLENEHIILDPVRSNLKGDFGFLKDIRRLAVAMTRARTSFTLLVDPNMLTREPFSARDRRAQEIFKSIYYFYEDEVAPFFPPQKPLRGTLLGSGPIAWFMNKPAWDWIALAGVISAAMTGITQSLGMLLFTGMVLETLRWFKPEFPKVLFRFIRSTPTKALQFVVRAA